MARLPSEDIPRAYLTDSLNWNSAVPGELVHRRGRGQVLLTAVSRRDDDAFLLGVRWPRSPSTWWTSASGYHDPILIPETLRQAGIAVAHAGYGVAFDNQFIMSDMRFELADIAPLTVSDDPAQLLARLDFSDIRHKQGRLKRALVGLSLERHGQLVGRGAATLVCLDVDTYRKLRARSQAPTAPYDDAPETPVVDPAIVGRSRPAEVLLCQPKDRHQGSHAGSWRLHIDTSDPELFDHQVDHLPGMVQLEVFRQAALALGAEPVTPERGFLGGCQVTFRRIVELGQATWCHAEIVDSQTVSVQLRQDGTPPLTDGTITLYRDRPPRVAALVAPGAGTVAETRPAVSNAMPSRPAPAGPSSAPKRRDRDTGATIHALEKREPMAPTNETLIRSRYEAFARGDLQFVADLFDDDIVWAVPGDNQISGTYHGAQEIVALFGKIMTLTEGQFHLDVRRLLADDECAFAQVNVTAVRGGRTSSFDAVQVWSLRDGKVIRFEEYLTDQATVDDLYA